MHRVVAACKEMALKPIGSYAERFAQISLEEYLADDPPAVLLQDAASGSFQPVGDEPGDTLFRVEPTPDPGDSGLDLSRGSLPKDQAYIVVPLDPAEAGARPRLVLGCAEHCDLRIADGSISREHALLERKGDDYWLEDENSTTGTRVNDDPLSPGEPQMLVNGDRITFGTVTLTFLEPDAFYGFVCSFLELG